MVGPRLSAGAGAVLVAALAWPGCTGEGTVPTLVGPGVDGGPQPVTAALFDPDLGDGFFSFPWPSDARLTETWAPDLTSFPTHGPGDMMDVYVALAMEMVVGFGTNPSLHVRFDGDLDPERLPAPLATLESDSPVQLIDVDPDSPGKGTRIPLLLDYRERDSTYMVTGTLSAFPAVGFPLDPGTTYALVVLDTLGDEEGRPLVVLEALQELLDGEGEPALSAVYAPLAASMEDLGLDRGSIAVATVFTTGDPTAELRAIRDWVARPDALPAPEVAALGPDDTFAGFEFMTVYKGTYETPVFQRGEPPYSFEGGGFEFEDGVPVVQRWESLRFHLTVPTGEPPEGGFPIVLALPGTGGDTNDHFHPHSENSQGLLLSERGVATFSFEPPLIGSRGEPYGAMPELHSYNVANPESSRSLFRQEALDASVAIRFLRESLAPAFPELQLDPSRLGFFGHSQGAHAGCLLAAVEPELDPVFINGMGGVLIYTLLERTDPLDFEAMIRVAIGEEEDPLTVFHPALDVVQLLGDAVDPINYARDWFLAAPPGEGTSVLHSAGQVDVCAPYITVNALAVASGTPPVEPLEWGIPELDWLDREPIATPYSGNLTAADGEALTGGLITRADQGHHVVKDDHDVAWSAAEFLATGLIDGVPTVACPDD